MTCKTIFITGATGGVGEATSHVFAYHGYRVAIGYHSNTDKANAMIADLDGDGHIAVQCTTNDTDSVTRAVSVIQDAFGGLDVLMNNGGSTRFVPHGDLDALTDDIIDSIFQVHVRGMLACTRGCVPIMNDVGVIVNITSIAGTSGLGSNIAYCGAKAAVNTITKSLARALAPKLRVIGVAPGLLRTDFVQGDGVESFFEDQTHLTPLNRLGTTHEVANAVYTGVEHLTFTTGSVIGIDGGRLLT